MLSLILRTDGQTKPTWQIATGWEPNPGALHLNIESLTLSLSFSLAPSLSLFLSRPFSPSLSLCLSLSLSPVRFHPCLCILIHRFHYGIQLSIHLSLTPKYLSAHQTIFRGPFQFLQIHTVISFCYYFFSWNWRTMKIGSVSPSLSWIQTDCWQCSQSFWSYNIL